MVLPCCFNNNFIIFLCSQGFQMGGSFPRRNRKGRGLRRIQVHLHCPLRVSNPGHWAWEEHTHRCTVLHRYLPHHGDILGVNAADDGLGSIQTLPGSHGQRFHSDGNCCRLRNGSLHGHPVHWDQLCVAFAHVQWVIWTWNSWLIVKEDGSGGTL